MKKFLSKKIAALLLTGVISLNIYAIEDDQSPEMPVATEVQPVVQEVQTPAPTQKPSKTSRKKTDKFKQETFKLGQGACIFCTVGKDPYIKTVRPDIDELKIIKCGKAVSKTTNQKVTNTSDLENLAPLCITTLNYGGNTKSVVKYRGDREAFIGKALEYILLPFETYTGKLLVDEYKANLPMFWILNNVEELVAIKTYFAKNLDPEFVPTQKTLLVLKVNSDQKLETLDDECNVFLSKYFEIYPLTDSDIKEFFEKTIESINSTSFDMENSNPLYVGETIMQSIFRQVEKNYKRFQAKDIVIAAGVTFFGTLILTQISDEFRVGKDIVFKKLSERKDANNKVIPGSEQTTIIGFLKDRFENCRGNTTPPVALTTK